MIYIDIGSSTVKIYRSDKRFRLIESKSFHFKQNFTPETGLSESDRNAFIKYIKEIQEKFPNEKIKTFATAIFRQISPKAKQELIDLFFQETGLCLNIVSSKLESFYNEMALAGEYSGRKPILLMNIGGGSTELIIKQNNKSIVRYNLEIGVGTVMSGFPFLNDEFSRHKLSYVVESIKENLPDIDLPAEYAIYNGGELTYMELAKYNLINNSIFEDQNHPKMISYKDFIKRNNEIFSKVSLSELENLMPENPRWMHGARACSALAQAIIEHFNVKNIIPSDSNMINGVIKQEFRSVVISGSYRKHLDEISELKEELEKENTHILSPRYKNPINKGEEFIVFDEEEGMSLLEIERYHLNSIDECDALIVCNPGGYVGASVQMEIGFAFAKNKRIIFTEKPSEKILTTMPLEIGL